MELTESYADLIEVDAEVLAISTDDLSTAGRIIASTSAPFPILYDPAAGAVREFGVYDLLHDGLATPSTFVVDKRGVIRWKYVGQGIYDRPALSEVLEQLRLIEG